MKNIAIIPARGGSKRIPEKNIQLFGGLPLLVHSIQYALANSAFIDAVYVSTDDLAIKEIALAYGAKVIDRPDHLSGDLEPTITTVQHVLGNLGFEVENVILLQPTNPLRPPNLLKDCLEKFQNEKVDSLFTVTQNYQKFGKITSGTFVPFNYEIGQRSQDLEPLYFENGLLYITKAKSILENKIITENAFPYLVNHIFAHIDIDTKEDMEYAAYLYQKFTTSNS
ncbi:acylneuraminate cytidylyltransferase family protein [Flavobacterium petrolei]|uniref:Acylneuraminate cytidylyltransferase family protein n=1 Tax=Flavobacterium petrolei TaxID=2259594 RepID=A0A482TRG3_9FLAO|nr:acylneuraminate cytidylyltransferase family protein [Flavobacterium petrolei]RYJ50884.1 acylneuraminate cytidylyltransferase family protein [Flavobacterium petrolei]